MTLAGFGRLARLTALYAAQGLPFGFTTMYLPLQLAQRPDFTYAKATLITLAGFPWLLKMLWAPAADTRYLASIGRRRSWILPAQLLLCLTALFAAGLDFQGPLLPVFAVASVLNLWASIQDTAVDGLAVETLSPEERGLGNAAQVGGYKLGMVAGGAGLVYVAQKLGQPAAMYALAIAVALLMLVPLLYREPPAPREARAVSSGALSALRRLFHTLRGRGWIATLLFIATVKVGETMVSNVLKPFLVREGGFTADRAAFAVGVAGLGFSLAGTVVGGIIAGRVGRVRALVAFGVLQAALLAALGIAAAAGVTGDRMVVLVAAEHFSAGLLTPALFAYLMDVSDTAIAATHYTFLATIELVAKGLGGAVAGFFADALGAGPFMIGAALAGALPLLLVPRIRQPEGGIAPTRTAESG